MLMNLLPACHKPLPMPTLSSDGYVRLSVDLLNNTPLIHLLSALDDDTPCHAAPQVLPPYINGYSEWISEGQPTLSIGWDWQASWQNHQLKCELIDTPRSNIMLINQQQHDFGHYATLDLLKHKIQMLDWQPAVISAILQVYSLSSCHN